MKNNNNRKNENKEYIIEELHVEPENIDLVLETMDKYGDNRWWLEDDIRKKAYYQFSENILLIDFDTFIKGISELLGRTVTMLGLLYDITQEELDKKYNEFFAKDSF